MMRLFVESLSAYNSGRMVGDWIAPLDYSQDDFLKRVEEVTRGADEKFVTDYENAPNCGEYPNLKHYWQLCHDIREMRTSVDLKVLIKYVKEHITAYADIETFYRAIDELEDNSLGLYASVQDFVDEMAENDGFNQIPEHWQWHVDWGSYRKHLEDHHAFIDIDDQVLVVIR
jgi:antirestriction protein